MIKKHETLKDVGAVSTDRLLSCLEEACRLAHDAEEVYKILVSFKEGELFEDDAVEELEAYTKFNALNLGYFHAWKCSHYTVVNKYLDDVIERIKVAEKNLNIAIDLMLAIKPEELDSLIGRMYDLASGLYYFIIKEFDLEDTILDEECQDEIVVKYCSKKRYDYKDFATKMVVKSREFKLKVDLFDEFPQYEDAFYDAVGVDIISIDQSKLTLEMLKQFFGKEITIEELIALCQKDYTDGFDEGEEV